MRLKTPSSLEQVWGTQSRHDTMHTMRDTYELVATRERIPETLVIRSSEGLLCQDEDYRAVLPVRNVRGSREGSCLPCTQRTPREASGRGMLGARCLLPRGRSTPYDIKSWRRGYPEYTTSRPDGERPPSREPVCHRTSSSSC